MKFSRFAAVAVFSTFAFLSGPAWAQATVGDFRKSKNDEAAEQVFTLYVAAVQDGLLWANAMLSASGDLPLYCAPRRLGLNGPQVYDIVERYVDDAEMSDDTVLGMAVLFALTDTFPCENERPANSRK